MKKQQVFYYQCPSDINDRNSGGLARIIFYSSGSGLNDVNGR